MTGVFSTESRGHCRDVSGQRRLCGCLIGVFLLSLAACGPGLRTDTDGVTEPSEGRGSDDSGTPVQTHDATPPVVLGDAASPVDDAGSASRDAGSGAAGDAGSIELVTVLDPLLEEGEGPSACADSLCGADRAELPRGAAEHRLSPATVVPEPPRIERILRYSELANPECLSDCPANAGEDAVCSSDCRGRVVQPSLPADRTTTDGRLVLTGGTRAAVSASRLDGLTDSPLVLSDLDLRQRAVSREMEIDVSSAHVPPGVIARRPAPNRFFCAQDQAPQRCGQDDCYDLILVEEWQGEGQQCPNGWAQCARMASAPVSIRVRNPKTADAVVVEARVTGDWVASQAYPAQTAEPIPTADGRLVVFRLLGGYPLAKGIGMDYAFVKNDGTTMRGRYSLSYVFSEQPCDVRAWFSTQDDGAYANMRPWSAAHYDRRLSRYGFAAYPLRDAHGQVFKEGELVRGSYPWMDRHGNNLFFSTILPVGVDDAQNGATRYPMTVEHARLGRPTGRTPTGFAVAGSWTHGKIVMLDGVLNNEDYSIDPGDTRRFELYRTASGTPINVRVDGNSNTRAFPTPNTRGNTQHMESLENTHAMHTAMGPVTPRDVVWTLRRGDAMQEVAFDDMLDLHVLLLAPMNAAWRMPRGLNDAEQAFGTRRGHYQDGFEFASGAYVHDPSAIELQNMATSPNYPIASHGSVRGNARVEPVAQGGIEGRGLWLEPEALAHFDFPSDITLPVRSFYVSTFFDARAALAGGRHLLSVRGASGTTHMMVHPGGLSVHREREGDPEIASFVVPSDHPWRADGWHHVGVLFGESGLVTAFVDGDPIGQRRMTKSVQLAAGARVEVGGKALGLRGARGWFDDVRLVIAGKVSQLEGPASIELLCNYARGSMATLSEASARFTAAERGPWVRARAEALGLSVASGQRLRCVTDYSADLTIRIPLPKGESSLRSKIFEQLAGAATLHAGLPRPDTTGNAFCLTCHGDTQGDALRPRGLSLAALTSSNTPVERDGRMQPGQPYAHWGEPALIQGVVPAKWFISIYGVPVPETQQLLDAPRPIMDWWLTQ